MKTVQSEQSAPMWDEGKKFPKSSLQPAGSDF